MYQITKQNQVLLLLLFSLSTMTAAVGLLLFALFNKDEGEGCTRFGGRRKVTGVRLSFVLIVEEILGDELKVLRDPEEEASSPRLSRGGGKREVTKIPWLGRRSE